MDKLKLELEHCYGINSLQHTFEFPWNKTKKGEDKIQCKTILLYAPNGVMKTSLAKTFNDIEEDRISRDIINPSNKTKRKISITEGDNSSREISDKEIFSISPYTRKEKYESKNIASLLVNKKLCQEYQEINNEIQSKKKEFLEKMKVLGGIKDTNQIEDFIIKDVGAKEFHQALGRLDKEVTTGTPKYEGCEYSVLFNQQTEKIYASPNFNDEIKTYVERYNELLDKSNFFKKGVFDHSQAEDIASRLEKNNFFDAEHSINLHSKLTSKNSEPIESKEALIEVIEKEKVKILTDETLLISFNKIEKMFEANTATKKLKTYLSGNPQITAELLDIPVFKSHLWASYFCELKDDFIILLQKFEMVEEHNSKLITAANEENDIWDKVVDDFNDRFNVPFRLRIKNRAGINFEEEVPAVIFDYDDEQNSRKEDVPKNDVEDALSQGESKALYIIHVLFEIESIKLKMADGDIDMCLLVVDDIADSFDYRNKYAIIEYLKEIADDKNNNFYQIILTHNFDFFRNAGGRLSAYTSSYIASKHKQEIKVETVGGKGLIDPFSHWKMQITSNKKQIDKRKYMIACIPLIRNLIEYSLPYKKPSIDFKKLTNLLHIKFKEENCMNSEIKDSSSYTFRDLEKLYKDYSIDVNKISEHLDDSILDTVFELCDAFSKETEYTFELTSKIILSIGTRLKVEKFTIDILGPSVLDTIENKNQTWELTEKYNDSDNPKDEVLSILRRVGIMTPEGIHINSFMYEPIIDMSVEDLRKLYKDVCNMG